MLFVSIRLSVRGHRCINLDDGLTFSKNPECEDTCGCVNTDTYWFTSHAQSIGALLFIFAARLSKETKLTHKSAGEYVSVFYEATHLWLVIGVLHILVVYLGKGCICETHRVTWNVRFNCASFNPLALRWTNKARLQTCPTIALWCVCVCVCTCSFVVFLDLSENIFCLVFFNFISFFSARIHQWNINPRKI